MQNYLVIIVCCFMFGCGQEANKTSPVNNISMNQNSIHNEQLRSYSFLTEMYQDSYFPDNLVDQGKAILVNLCLQIEDQAPKDLAELYVLTHAATEKFNDLESAFDEQGSEIETVAREAIGMDFDTIAAAYGFEDADGEELIAPRDW